MDAVELVDDATGPVGEDVVHGLAVRDPERQVEIRPPVAAAGRQRPDLGARDDARVDAGQLEHVLADPVALLDGEHAR